MKYIIQSQGFNSVSRFGDKGLAKAYVVYRVELEKPLTIDEYKAILSKSVTWTLRKDRLKVDRLWTDNGNKALYVCGKQSHGYGYGWDVELDTLINPLLKSL